ncbi:MAG: 50S ribosomal protein L11 methyltransferase [Alteraurantiacibacter sp.]
MNWKLVARGTKDRVEAALDRQGDAWDWDENVVVTGYEIARDRPDDWQLDAYTQGKPTAAQKRAVAALFDTPVPKLTAEQLPAADWVAESQKGMDPIRAGRFFVHTPDHAPSSEPGVTSFCIPAAQAFGTGQHATTWGCLAMLDAMKQQGVVARNLADIGTGTGLLAFAALTLWRHAKASASDIDPVCLPAVIENAAGNGFTMGTEPGALAMVVAEGMDDAFLAARAPYDLLIANILAAPLIALAGDFADAMYQRGNIVLSGLLVTQEAQVLSAYRKAGFRLQARIHRGDWAVLWLRHRFQG